MTLFWRYGSDEGLGARLRNSEGAPASDATVSFDILDRAGAVVLSGSLNESITPGTYIAVVDTKQLVPLDEIDYASAAARKFKARVRSELEDGSEGEAMEAIFLHHDID